VYRRIVSKTYHTWACLAFCQIRPILVSWREHSSFCCCRTIETYYYLPVARAVPTPETSTLSPVVTAPMSATVPTQLERGYDNAPKTNVALSSTAAADFGSTPGNPSTSSPLSQSVQQQQHYGKFSEDWEASQRGTSIIDGPTMQRSNSVQSQGESTLLPSRGGTLKKKASMKRTGSLRRSSSRRSSRAGSVRSLALQPSGDVDEMQSAFYSPVPTTGNPTEILANRFQGMYPVQTLPSCS
jgi:hypothetical protein